MDKIEEFDELDDEIPGEHEDTLDMEDLSFLDE